MPPWSFRCSTPVIYLPRLERKELKLFMKCSICGLQVFSSESLFMTHLSYLTCLTYSIFTSFLCFSTLRAYLSDKLHCDPMRITKKFTGSSCIGKRVFHPAVRCAENAAAMDSAQEELVSLEKRWRKRLKLKKSSGRRSSSKRESKATESAAASPPTSSAAAVTGATVGHHRSPSSTPTGIVSPPAESPPSEEWSVGSSMAAHTTPKATGTATSNEQSMQVPTSAAHHPHGSSWIDRAQALLGGESTVNGLSSSSENSFARRKVSESSHNSGHEGKEQRAAPPSNIAATVTPSEAKDAEALVGFLNSVRAEAASGGGM